MRHINDPITDFEKADVQAKVSAFLTESLLSVDIIYKHFVSQTTSRSTQEKTTTWTNIYIDNAMKGSVTQEDFERDMGLFERVDSYFRIAYADFSTISYSPNVRDLLITDWSDAYTATYVSGTTFTLVGDQTSIFTAGVELKVADASTLSNAVDSSSVTTGVTTVTVLNNTLTASLSSVYVGKVYEVAKPRQKGFTGRSSAIGIDNVASTYFKIAGRLV